MYICKNCGAVFEEPDIEAYDPSPDGVGLPRGYYEIHYCPMCGGDWIEQADKCPSCGEYFIGGIVCDDCRETLSDGLNRLRQGMGLNKADFADAIADHFNW